MKKLRVTLVHGTFARNAPWVRPGSSFQRALEEDLREKIVFEEPLLWSGRNSIRHRWRAADQLAARVFANQRAHPDDLHVAIGHSHGGSVIAYALGRHAALAASMVGVAFLATPFVDIRPQPAWRRTVRTLCFGLSAVMWCALTITSLLTYESAHKVLGIIPVPGLSHGTVELFMLVSSVLVGLGFFWVAGCVAGRFVTATQLRLGKLVEAVSTSVLPEGPLYMFALSPGDEAAGTLSFAEMLAWPFAWIMARAASLFTWGTGYLSNLWHSGWRGRSVTVLMVFLFAMGFFFTYARAMFFNSYPSVSDFVSAPFSTVRIDLTLQGPQWYDTALDGLMTTVMILTLVIGTFIVVAFAIWTVATVFVAASYFAFGTSFWSAGPFVELAVEPLPCGTWPLHRLDWPSGADEAGLNWSHSDPYSSVEGQRVLRQWLRNIYADHENNPLTARASQA